MIIYNNTKEGFLADVESDIIVSKIEEMLKHKMNRYTGLSEYKSWEESLPYMYNVLKDNDIPSDAGIAIEYNVPQTSRRIDFMISGYDSFSKPSVIVIELKGWKEAESIPESDSLVKTFTGGAIRTVVHPSYQAWSYASLIRDYNQNVQDKCIELKPCVYLHNYIKTAVNDPLTSSQYDDYIEEAPVFLNGEIVKFRNFIKKYIVNGDSSKILYEIDNSKLKPSKSLQDSIKSMLQGNREFIMIDDQRIVYNEIMKYSLLAQKNEEKYTIIVEGGPGTGKSVIAINLLAELTNCGQVVQYASKNSAPRDVYKARLKGSLKNVSIDNLFRSSDNYVDAEENVFDTILVDEAHRLREHSGFMNNLGVNQIKEIINASRCNVFFIDESQRVTLSDIGRVSLIEHFAALANSTVFKFELASQFRCNGSDGYPAWVDNALQIRETANYEISSNEYDVRVVDSPSELRNMITEHNNENGRSRILAGYCWEWQKDKRDDPDHFDINIGDFHMSWNLESSVYAVTDSIDQVGCIHTSQGLEFEYVGVIIGEDLRYSNNKIITDFNKRAKTDQSLKGIKKMYKGNPSEALAVADEIIKNTYRTLLTRGMKGCYIYCVDKDLAEYLKSIIK